MAKMQRSIIKVQGTIDGNTYVDSARYGYHMRKAIGPQENVSPAVKKENSRTAFINGVSAEIKNMFQKCSPLIFESDTYLHLNKLFRKEPLNSRFMFLQLLKNREVSSSYPLAKIDNSDFFAQLYDRLLIVHIKMKAMPEEGENKADCYFYEMNLMYWTTQDAPGVIKRIRTYWKSINEKPRRFEFQFNFPENATHWMLCQRMVVGKNGASLGIMTYEGMRVVAFDTFAEEEYAILLQRNQENGISNDPPEQTEEDIEYVDAVD